MVAFSHKVEGNCRFNFLLNIFARQPCADLVRLGFSKREVLKMLRFKKIIIISSYTFLFACNYLF